MTLVHAPGPQGHGRSRNAVRLGRAVTVSEFLVLLVVFGTVVGLAVGTGLAHLLVVVLQHVDDNVRHSHA
jgi:hypothetical protein